jgi:broad specificity phosphatase PhoE
VAGGRDDSPLTQHGIDEAAATAQKIRFFQGVIVSSPMQRALKTAEIIRDQIAPHLGIMVEPTFIERDVGDATGMAVEEYFALERAGTLIPNAETEQELYDRAKRGVDMLRKLQQPVLLVTHFGVYRMLVCVLEGRPPHDYASVPRIQNGEVKILEL